MSTVVVVDDHAGFRSTLRRLLERDGYRVIGEAADGASALGLLRNVHPSLVVLDIGLPDLDGFGVLRLLRNSGDATPVVLVSSRDARAYAPSLLAADAAGFLVKSGITAAALNSLLTRR
jgi:DNA-binding NarL/FixJ family response regulator